LWGFFCYIQTGEHSSNSTRFSSGLSS
jgi:hypothetical protein